MAGEPAFFELGVEDWERGKAFYEGLFGWSFEPGPSGQGYQIRTPSIPGGIHGGDKGASPYVFFAVDDIDAALAGLRTHGAELIGEVVQYEDSYRLCYVRGPEGIIVALAEQLS